MIEISYHQENLQESVAGLKLSVRITICDCIDKFWCNDYLLIENIDWKVNENLKDIYSGNVIYAFTYKS